MKKPVLGIASLALMGGFLLAESIDPPQAHIDWMKGVAKATGRMKKGEDVENNAKHVAETMAKVGKFYSEKNLPAGVKASNEGVAAANAIAKAAAGGDTAGVQAGMRALGGSCKGCHDVHREKVSDTENKIKW